MKIDFFCVKKYFDNFLKGEIKLEKDENHFTNFLVRFMIFCQIILNVILTRISNFFLMRKWLISTKKLDLLIRITRFGSPYQSCCCFRKQRWCRQYSHLSLIPNWDNIWSFQTLQSLSDQKSNSRMSNWKNLHLRTWDFQSIVFMAKSKGKVNNCNFCAKNVPKIPIF